MAVDLLTIALRSLAFDGQGIDVFDSPVCNTCSALKMSYHSWDDIGTLSSTTSAWVAFPPLCTIALSTRQQLPERAEIYQVLHLKICTYCQSMIAHHSILDTCKSSNDGQG